MTVPQHSSPANCRSISGTPASGSTDQPTQAELEEVIVEGKRQRLPQPMPLIPMFASSNPVVPVPDTLAVDAAYADYRDCMGRCMAGKAGRLNAISTAFGVLPQGRVTALLSALGSYALGSSTADADSASTTAAGIYGGAVAGTSDLLGGIAPRGSSVVGGIVGGVAGDRIQGTAGAFAAPAIEQAATTGIQMAEAAARGQSTGGLGAAGLRMGATASLRTGAVYSLLKWAQEGDCDDHCSR
jgi:hypothetical protein